MLNRNTLVTTLGLTLTLALALPAPAHPGLGQDAKAQITQRYREFDALILANKEDTVLKWFGTYLTSDFFYASRDKNKYPRAQFLEMVKNQMAATKKVTEAVTKVGSIAVKGTVATVHADSSTKALITADSKTLSLVDKDKTVDTWVLQKGQWKLKSSVQTDADTKMTPVEK